MPETPETPQGQDCPAAETHGNPFRYCGECGWIEPEAKPVPAADHLALLTAAATEDDFRVQLAGAELVDVLEYIALSIFQLRGIVNQSVPMLDGLTKHPLLKGLFR